MATNLGLLILAIVVASVYAILANRVLVFGKRFHARALDLAEPLLRDSRVRDDIKREIEDDLATLPNWLPAWGVALLITPCAIGILLSGSRRFKERANAFVERVPVDRRDQYADFHDATLMAWLANSPAAAILAALQFAFWSFWISGQELASLMVEKVAEKITHANNHSGVEGKTA